MEQHETVVPAPEPSPPVPATSPQDTVTDIASVTSAPKVAAPVVKPVAKTPEPTSSVSSILPTVQVERATEPFVLKGSAHTTTAPVTPPPSNTPEPVTTVSEPQAATIADNVVVMKVDVESNTALTTHHSANSDKRPTLPESVAVATKAVKLKATGIPTSPPLSPTLQKQRGQQLIHFYRTELRHIDDLQNGGKTKSYKEA